MKENINVQWFPGHMAKAGRMISDNMRMVDAVCEVVDARIPVSSRNPDLDSLAGNKPRLIVLNRTDQADPKMTSVWAEVLRKKGCFVIETDSRSGKGMNTFIPAVTEMLKDKLAAYAEKGQSGKTVRLMVVGIPNVGKSSFINRIAGRKAAETSDRPGVTRGKQWISVGSGIEFMDTPGILWPKFDDPAVGERLAFTGAVKDDILDVEGLACRLMKLLAADYPDRLRDRYKITVDENDLTGYENLTAAAKARGFLLRGGEYDTERMARILLDEFRSGKLGRITLERPAEGE